MTRTRAALAAVLLCTTAAAACSTGTDVEEPRTVTHEGREYVCITSDGYNSGGIWCERIGTGG